MMSGLGVLRSYAQKTNPASSLPSSVLLTHSPTSITIFDAYPKAIFHFLVIPRLNVTPTPTVFDLVSLKTLLKSDRERAKEVLLALKKDAKEVEGMIQEEMEKRFGFRWAIWMGFHAAPSVEHLHLHVISSDMCALGMKTKKHYNSFHPKLGFFLQLDNVLEWFEGESSYFSAISELKKSKYEPLLKEDLSCWRCGHTAKNMPSLKSHLQEEWDKEASREKVKEGRKRKRETQEEATSKKRTATGEHPSQENDPEPSATNDSTA